MNSLERSFELQIEIDLQIDEIDAAVDRVLESIPASELIDAMSAVLGQKSFTAKAEKAERLTGRGNLADRAPANSVGKGGRGESPEPPPARRSSWDRRLDAGGVIPSGPTLTEDDMKLPEGKTCSDCYAFKFCAGLFGCKPTNTTCDWAPSRFYQKDTQ